MQVSPMQVNCVEASIILPKGMDGQQIILRAELEVKGVHRPVRWAYYERTNPDG